MLFREKAELVLVLLVMAVTPLHGHPKTAQWPSGQKLRLELSRGGFEILRYPAKLDSTIASPKALIIFGTGCSGWSYWEERVCCKLQSSGYEVLGLDFALYSRFDYSLDNLQADYQKIIQYGLRQCGNQPVPVILGGWSTGAEQAVAVAGGPHPPPGLVGLLLVSPGSEGGFAPKGFFDHEIVKNGKLQGERMDGAIDQSGAVRRHPRFGSLHYRETRTQLPIRWGRNRSVGKFAIPKD